MSITTGRVPCFLSLGCAHAFVRYGSSWHRRQVKTGKPFVDRMESLLADRSRFDRMDYRTREVALFILRDKGRRSNESADFANTTGLLASIVQLNLVVFDYNQSALLVGGISLVAFLLGKAERCEGGRYLRLAEEVERSLKRIK